MKSKCSGFEDFSVPNDELASQNMISEPDEIEDSKDSNYSQICEQNARRRDGTRLEADFYKETMSGTDQGN